MTRTRLVLSVSALTLLSGLLGCDVAVIAILAARGNKKNTSSSTPAPDTSYFLFATSTALTPDMATEETTLAGNGGVPGSNWAQVGSGHSTAVFSSGIPAGSDTFLVQVTANQQYEIDALEVLDSNGYPTEWGSGTVRNARISTTPPSAVNNVLGRPDGKTALTQAIAGQNAFVFLRFSAPVTSIRVNLWEQSQRGPGDMEWEYTASLGGSQSTGGCAVNTLDVIHVAFKNDTDGSTFLVRLDQDGTLIQDDSGSPAVDFTTLEPIGASSVPGSPSVAVQAPSNTIYVSTTAQSGVVHLFRFASNMTGRTTLINFTGSGNSRFEGNGLSIDSNGGKCVVGGTLRTTPAQGINPLIFRLNSSDAVVDNTDRQGDTADNEWYACIVLPNLDILAVGDETGSGGNLDGLMTQISSANLNTQTAAYISGAANLPDRALAVGIDSPPSPASANYYVAGYLGTGASTHSGFLVRINGGVFSSRTTYTLPLLGDSEVQDIAVLPDGTVYATGFEKPGSRKILFVMCLDPSGNLVWKRTHQLDIGDDQGVSIAVSGTHVWVAGSLTVAASNTDVHVRKYVR